MEKADKVKELIAERLGIKIDRVNSGQKLEDDLGMDDLDCVELQMELEKEFDIIIPGKDFEKLITVGDVIKCISGLVPIPVRGFKNAKEIEKEENKEITFN